MNEQEKTYKELLEILKAVLSEPIVSTSYNKGGSVKGYTIFLPQELYAEIQKALKK